MKQTPWNRIVTTTAPATSPGSLERVKASLGLTNGVDHDTGVQEAILAASRAVSSDLGRALVTTTFTLYLDKFPSREIQLPWPPLVAVDSIKYWGQTTETLDTFSSGSYTVSTGGDPGRVQLNDDANWPSLMDRFAAIEIQFQAGFGSDADDVPDSIRTAVSMTAAYFWEQPLPVIVGTISSELPLGASRLIESERFVRY